MKLWIELYGGHCMVRAPIHTFVSFSSSQTNAVTNVNLRGGRGEDEFRRLRVLDRWKGVTRVGMLRDEDNWVVVSSQGR